MKFIIWDPRDGAPRRDDEDNIISDGAMGRITEDNVYLTTYACWPKEWRFNALDEVTLTPSYRELAVGECIKGVIYSLSGSRGVYDVWRVE